MIADVGSAAHSALMALDWAPQRDTYYYSDKDGPHEKDVIGLLAYIPDGRFYEIWPIDPMDTDSDGWKLSPSDGANSQDLGTKGDIEQAKDAAEKREYMIRLPEKMRQRTPTRAVAPRASTSQRAAVGSIRIGCRRGRRTRHIRCSHCGLSRRR